MRSTQLAALVAAGLLATGCVAEQEVADPTATTVVVTTPGATTTTVPAGEAVVPLEDVRIELVELTGGLNDPVAMQTRSGTANLYIAERGGRIRVIERQVKVDARTGISSIASERLSSSSVLDLTDEVHSAGPEQGLLGFAFSLNGSRLYVAYTSENGTLRVVEHEMRALEDRADSDGKQLMAIEQGAENHNGGHLVFGADGFLYIGVGDGGGQGDPFGVAQNTSSSLGTILRVDPDVLRVGEDPPPYEIPTGNPFRDGEGGLREIWLFGVQDPWRFSFDRLTGDLWVADTGGQREEITRLLARNGTGRGANLGWDLVEGSEATGDVPAGAVAPIYDYPHGEAGCRVVGGFVYRGKRIEGLDGSYLFGDRCTGRIMALRPHDDGTTELRDLGEAVPADQLIAFGADDDGEPYILTTDGTVRRVGQQPAP